MSNKTYLDGVAFGHNLASSNVQQLVKALKEAKDTFERISQDADNHVGELADTAILRIRAVLGDTLDELPIAKRERILQEYEE